MHSDIHMLLAFTNSQQCVEKSIFQLCEQFNFHTSKIPFSLIMQCIISCLICALSLHWIYIIWMACLGSLDLFYLNKTNQVPFSHELLGTISSSACWLLQFAVKIFVLAYLFIYLSARFWHSCVNKQKLWPRLVTN